MSNETQKKLFSKWVILYSGTKRQLVILKIK